MPGPRRWPRRERRLDAHVRAEEGGGLLSVALHAAHHAAQLVGAGEVANDASVVGEDEVGRQRHLFGTAGLGVEGGAGGGAGVRAGARCGIARAASYSLLATRYSL